MPSHYQSVAGADRRSVPRVIVAMRPGALHLTSSERLAISTCMTRDIVLSVSPITRLATRFAP